MTDGVWLEVAPGEIVGILGPNDAGKPTLFNLVAGTVKPDAGRVVFQGLVAPRRGRVSWRGRDITGLPGSATVALGIALVPEGRRLFRSLAVEEYLIRGGQAARRGPWGLRAV